MSAAIRPQQEGYDVHWVYLARNGMTAMPKKEADARVGERLSYLATATTIRVRNGKLSPADGSFVETEEQPRRLR